ncbi:hypothetical protein [Acidovorax sp. SUPP2522]|uniref:hypothetical protein n=1 Tax=Acidovorax sp. SUPP2522 TaxID=511900 RepID=UPI0024E10F54|nr:hypothetical protein [Acidovorax sp. SUPP2522]
MERMPSPPRSESHSGSSSPDRNELEISSPRASASGNGYEGTSWAPSVGAPWAFAAETTNGESIQRKAAAWVDLNNTILQHDDVDPRLSQALKNLFFVFADSSEFRSTMRSLEAGGPVHIQVDAEAGRSYFAPGTRTVVLDEMRARDPDIAMATLAFELTNAALAPAFAEVERRAQDTGMSAAEYGEAIERVEYQTTESVHRYYREAQHSLQARGLGQARNWFSKIDPSGEVRRMFETEEDALRTQRMAGHTGAYEQSYQRNW